MDDAGAIHPHDITLTLEALAAAQPAAPAMYAPGRATLTYADLGAQVRYVRERLQHWNITRGDVVVGMVGSRPEMALLSATVPAASTFVPLGPELAPAIYAELFARLRPKALIVPKGLEAPGGLAHPVCGIARDSGVSEI